MDLISEETERKILTSRHINADKALHGENNAVNTTFLCYSYSLQPDFGTYYTALQPYAWVLWTCGLFALLAICVLYGVTVWTARRNWIGCRSSAAVVLAVYPVVAAAAFIAIVVPRGRLLAEAIAQQAVMVAMYHLFWMIVAECGGRDQLVRRAGGTRLDTRVLPCCCWPCCVIPRPQLQKQSLTLLRYLILQMPVFQALIYIVVLVLSVEDMMLYLRSFAYIQPFIAASILSGVWGMIMCIRAAESAGARPRARFMALQLVLLIVKLQCGLAKALPEMFTLPCVVALHPSVFVNLIQNSVMILEMLLLSLWAWRLYTMTPVKNMDNMQRVIHVAVLEDGGADIKAIRDVIDTRSYKNKSGIKL